MYIPFDSMPGHARLWIYQANRALTVNEKEKVKAGLKEFCEEWSAHGTPLHTSFDVQLDQFIILAVDEERSGISGCSIDGSVRRLKQLQENGLDFFDRTKVAFQTEEGSVVTHALADIKSLIESGTLSGVTTTFNNLVLTKAEWNEQWRIPVNDSWITHYLPKGEVAK